MRFTKGHLYLFSAKDEPERWNILKYIRLERYGKSIGAFHFRYVAEHCLPHTAPIYGGASLGPTATYGPLTIKAYDVKEITVEELPLYLHARTTYPEFERIIQNDSRTTQNTQRNS